ncbi:MAG: hypothetical protein IKU67_02620 [Firmicutes bacterium]|nr:hypothetical protein [Bacillota bacterium]
MGDDCRRDDCRHDDCRADDRRRLECCVNECQEKCVRDCYCNDNNGGNGILLLFFLILIYCFLCSDGKNGGLFGGLF